MPADGVLGAHDVRLGRLLLAVLDQHGHPRASVAMRRAFLSVERAPARVVYFVERAAHRPAERRSHVERPATARPRSVVEHRLVVGQPRRSEATHAGRVLAMLRAPPPKVVRVEVGTVSEVAHAQHPHYESAVARVSKTQPQVLGVHAGAVSILVLRAAVLSALAFSAALAVEYYLPGDTFCGEGGGCAAVRDSVVGQLIGAYLPALGVLAYTAVFAASIFRGRETARYAALMAIIGGIGAVGFLVLQAAVIGDFCHLCVGVDVSAIVAAAAGGAILWTRPGVADDRGSLRSPAWGFFVIALFGPMAYSITFPDPDIPPEVRELWRDDAEVNIVEMADFECPYCRSLHPVLRQVVEESGHDVHLARIVVPLPFHVHARDAAVTYFCAEAQGRGEEMADLLFASEDLTHAGGLQAANALGLDIDVWEACAEAPETQERIEADITRARTAGMQGLPSVYVGERVLLGFSVENGSAPYLEAVEAAGARRG